MVLGVGTCACTAWLHSPAHTASLTALAAKMRGTANKITLLIGCKIATLRRMLVRFAPTGYPQRILVRMKRYVYHFRALLLALLVALAAFVVACQTDDPANDPAAAPPTVPVFTFVVDGQAQQIAPDTLRWNSSLGVLELRSLADFTTAYGLDLWAEPTAGSTFIGSETDRAGYFVQRNQYYNTTTDTFAITARTASSISFTWSATLQPLPNGSQRTLQMTATHWPFATLSLPTTPTGNWWVAGAATDSGWVPRPVQTKRTSPDSLYLLATGPDTTTGPRISLRMVQPSAVVPGTYRLGTERFYAQFTDNDSTVHDLSGSLLLVGRAANQQLTARVLCVNGAPFKWLLLRGVAW
jgi:hypothetical protein